MANKMIELLAPARDKKCAFAAINSGADAIYIGATNFGARQNAKNSIEDLKDIINYAHIFGVKVYVTVNTILYENELAGVKELINTLYNIKTDAIIFQDFSLLNMDLPPIELHASTQCHNTNSDKILFLQKCNVKRVVLPREFSISQIKEIRQNTDIEIETFCHGALCVSYSGQCYLSDFIGKRSANRGECAQPCRKKYSLVDNNGKIYAKNQHLLCLKDFNASKSIEDLILSGVTSFKIEGRLKDENYVKNVTLKYRQIIDEILLKYPDYKRTSKGRIITDFTPNLNKTFNRDYCDYFLTEKRPQIGQNTSFQTPKFKGEFAGTVKNIFKNEIEINSKTKLNVQDGITFFDNNELLGTKIIAQNGKKYKLLSTKGIKIGTEIFRNYDNEFLNELTHANIKRKLAVKFEISFDDVIKITAICENYSVTKEFETNYELANNQDLAIENIKKQFSKLGNTNFEMVDIQILSNLIPHIKLSELNSMRNEVIQNLEETILKNYKTNTRNTDFKTLAFPICELDYAYNVSNRLAKEFYEKCGAKVEEFASEVTNNYKRLMVTKHCLKHEFDMCSKDVGQLYLVDEFNTKYPLKFDCKNCQMEILAPNINI